VKILTIQTGTTQDYIDKQGKAYRTSIYRKNTPGLVHLFKEHLAGDQVTSKSHGGPDKAVNVYSGEHYTYWQDALHIPLPANGSFGENFTSEGWLENEACIGDIYRVGTAVVQISQPRLPCATLARRWDIPDFIRIVNESGRTGWYLRVLQEGEVQAGDEISLQSRPYPEWSIARALEAASHRQRNPAEAASLAQCPALSATWVDMLSKAPAD
jgi:MOSC domain-containing protein YiiM